MNSYLVSWDIDVEASSPAEAAKQAEELFKRSDSTATFFNVIDKSTGGETLIDLLENENPSGGINE